MKNALRRRRLPALPVALATALLGSAVFAPLARDDLRITDPPVEDFDSVTLSGIAQTRTAELDAFSVTDSTGSGPGWRLTVQASQFTEYASGAYSADGKTLPSGSLTMPAQHSCSHQRVELLLQLPLVGAAHVHRALARDWRNESASMWIKADRRHPLIPREMKRWRDLYRGRAAVEREFGYLKHSHGLAVLRVRGLERVALHADLTILARLARELARTRVECLVA